MTDARLEKSRSIRAVTRVTMLRSGRLSDMGYCLRYQGRDFKLVGTITIGRGESCTITLDDPLASRTHASVSLVGDKVVNRMGEKLGDIKEFMLDTTNGCIAYTVLAHGGAMGMGEKLFGVPFDALSLDEENHQFVLDISKDEFERAPGFASDNWPNMSVGETGGFAHRFFGFGEGFVEPMGMRGTYGSGMTTSTGFTSGTSMTSGTMYSEGETWTPPSGHEGETWEYHREHCMAA